MNLEARCWIIIISLSSAISAVVAVAVVALVRPKPAVANNVRTELSSAVSNNAIAHQYFRITEFGGKGDGIADDSAAIQKAIDAAYVRGGGSVYMHAGVFKTSRTIVMKNGVNINGAGMYSTIIEYHGDAYAIDGIGAGHGEPPHDRKMIQLSDLQISGRSATGHAIGIRLGHNHRSLPLLQRVKISEFPHYGIYFAANNWIIAFVDVVVEHCGTRVPNSAGIFKDPAVTDLNAVRFTRCVIEGCGTPSSLGGGVFLSSTAMYTNRGWGFYDCVLEGNKGISEIFIESARAVSISNLYLEREEPDGRIGLDLADATGIVAGGVFAGAGNITHAIRLRNGSRFSIEGVQFSGWSDPIEASDGTVKGVLNFGVTVPER